jgi:hypothetical protein
LVPVNRVVIKARLPRPQPASMSCISFQQSVMTRHVFSVIFALMLANETEVLRGPLCLKELEPRCFATIAGGIFISLLPPASGRIR